MAVSGEIRWPSVGTFLAAYGENLMAIDSDFDQQVGLRGFFHSFLVSSAHRTSLAALIRHLEHRDLQDLLYQLLLN